MNKQSLGALLALNGVLLAALAVIGLTPQPAPAQQFVRSQYIMVAGDVVGRAEQAIYVIELNTGRVAALIFNGSNKTLEPVDGRSILNDLNAVGRR